MFLSNDNHPIIPLPVGEGLIADLVKGIRGVGHELSQEDLLVGVEGVDDERHQLADLSLERKGLGRHLLLGGGSKKKALFSSVHKNKIKNKKRKERKKGKEKKRKK